MGSMAGAVLSRVQAAGCWLHGRHMPRGICTTASQMHGELRLGAVEVLARGGTHISWQQAAM